MMQAKRYFLLLSLCTYAAMLCAQNTLRVSDPRQGWRNEQGTIAEAVFVVQAKETHTSIDLYLTFSAKGTSFYNDHDTVEVVYDFELPNGAIVYDSWLWIDTLIVKADIHDRWTAAQTYENIVGRRQDPSILYKNNDGGYQLRIFPMAGNQSRKVKISYLVPAHWQSSQVATTLPVNILEASRQTALPVTLRMREDPTWGNPLLSGKAGNDFVYKSDPTGNYWETIISLQAEDFNKKIQVVYPSPLQNGIYISKINTAANKGIYELALLPQQVFDYEDTIGQKVMVAVEYTAGVAAQLSQSALLEQLKNQLLQNLKARDSFNLILSKLNAKPISNKWLPADSTTIEATFAHIGTMPLANYSNLPTILAESIEFIQENGKTAEILLVSNSAQIGQPAAADQLLNDLKELMYGSTIRFYIADFLPFGQSFYYANNRAYQGNEYFYLNLMNLSNGYYEKLENHTDKFIDNLQIVFNQATAIKGTLDFRTSLENGLCFNRYKVNDNFIPTVNINETILQVGKFEGTFPFIIEATLLIGNQILTKEIVIEEPAIPVGDTLTQEVWSGMRIAYLDRHQSPIQSDILQIIDESLRERVLSRHTAFICLEPALGGKPCFDCVNEDGTVIVDVNNLALDSLVRITAAPNPFQDQIKLVLQFAENQDLSDYQFAIYNMVGQQVKTFNDLSQTITDRVELTWNTTDEVASGIYFFVVQTPQGRQSLKLVKL